MRMRRRTDTRGRPSQSASGETAFGVGWVPPWPLPRRRQSGRGLRSTGAWGALGRRPRRRASLRCPGSCLRCLSVAQSSLCPLVLAECASSHSPPAAADGAGRALLFSLGPRIVLGLYFPLNYIDCVTPSSLFIFFFLYVAANCEVLYLFLFCLVKVHCRAGAATKTGGLGAACGLR